MNKPDTFKSALDELNWLAVKASEGNIEAVIPFVQERNAQRAMQNGLQGEASANLKDAKAKERTI